MYQPTMTLTVHNARTVLEAGLRAIADGQTQVDLGGLSFVDSSAVATMLAWQRAAQRAGLPLSFRHLPASLQSLIDMYGINVLISESYADEGHGELSHY